jgi:adenylate cyclase
MFPPPSPRALRSPVSGCNIRRDFAARARMIHQFRIYSGLVLLVFVTVHLANHALGLISLEVMNAGRAVAIDPWRTGPGTVVLYGTVSIHAGIGLWTLYARRSLHMRGWEVAQFVLGLTIPLLLAGHVLATRFLVDLFDVKQDYIGELMTLWVFYPWIGLEQAVTLIVVWAHACIGIHTWLRLKPWYAALETYFFSVALLLPAFALAGYVASGIRVRELAAQDGWIERMMAAANADQSHIDWVFATSYWVQGVWLAVILAVFLGRGIRAKLHRARRKAKLYYRNFRESRVFDITPGWSVLEALRAGGIRHASVCGGRGRCTTCRVKVGEGAEHLDAPTPHERKVLERISAPPDVRLACQIRPKLLLEVTPLLPPSASPEDGFEKPGYVQGQEREVAIVFVDLRESTKLAENRLPFDVVFVLNQFFAEMADTLEDTGGHFAQFNGDGLMALYGLESDLADGCRRAFEGAEQMVRRLEMLNQRLGLELDKPLRIGIGIHAGDCIVGTMGPPKTPIITALGDNVNIAARLEAQTKELNVPLVVSAEAAKHAGIGLDGFAKVTVELRGRGTGIEVYAVDNPARMPLAQFHGSAQMRSVA